MMGGASKNPANPDIDIGLAFIITAVSRMIDLETGHGIGFWGDATGQTTVTRRYSGSGNQWMDVDMWDDITTVTMSGNQTRSDAQNLPVVKNPDAGGYVPTYNDVILRPFDGPPFTQLFLLRGFLPDAYALGNVEVTGKISIRPEIQHAANTWTVYEWHAKDAQWQDTASNPAGPGMLYRKGIPPEVDRILAALKQNQAGPRIAVLDGSDTRTSPWLGWRTA
jgi:hypothetical protein